MSRARNLTAAVVSLFLFASLTTAPVAASQPSLGLVRWATDLGSGAVSSPALGNDTILVGTGDGALAAVSQDTGAIRWIAYLNGLLGTTTGVTAPVIGKKVVYVGTTSGHLVALDEDTGLVRWVTDLGSGAVSSPALGNEWIYAGTGEGTLNAMDPATGALAWVTYLSVATGTSGGVGEPVVDKGLLYVGMTSGYLCALR